MAGTLCARADQDLRRDGHVCTEASTADDVASIYTNGEDEATSNRK